MKIDHCSLTPSSAKPSESKPVDKGSEGKPSWPSPAASNTDAVQVSSSAQLAAEAARRLAGAISEDDVRPDVVERAKAALAKGEVGADLDKLADRLIDGMLGE